MRYVYRLVNITTLCTNTQNIDVVVNAKPVITSTLSPADICSKSLFSDAPTSNQDPDVEFPWT